MKSSVQKLIVEKEVDSAQEIKFLKDTSLFQS